MTRTGAIGRCALAMLLAPLAGCSEPASAPAARGNAVAEAAPAVPATAPTPLAALYEPWEEPACRMLLKRKADGMHLAWVQGSEYGVSLNTHLDSIGTLPHVTDLGLRLRADGDSRREVAAKGQRGDGDSDSSTFVEIILDAPQRQLIDGAERIAVMRGASVLIELPVDSLADLDSVSKECTTGGPGRYVEE